MSSAEPPCDSATISTPENAAPACVGSPLSATLPLYSGLSRSLTLGDRRHLGGVVADRHVAAVVVDPGAVGVLERRGDVVERRDLVRREHRGVGQRHRLAEVEDVGRGALALLLVGGVDLVLAGGVGLRGVDLDAVLVAERLDDRAVVGPVRWQRDDIELALLLGRLDQGVHAAEVRGGCRLADLDAGGRLAARVVLLGRGACDQARQDERGGRRDCQNRLFHCRTLRWVGGGAVAQR